jgi:hypothetical protein
MGQDEQWYVIAITEDSYSSGEPLATALAGRFGYSLVTLETLLKRAPAFGADPDKLRELIENPPGLLRGMLTRYLATLRILRCVLAETIRSGNAVCYGDVAYLLPVGIPEICHLRVASPLSARLKAFHDVKHLDRIVAGKQLNDSDSQQSRWRKYVYRFERSGSPGIYDSTVNLEETSMKLSKWLNS